MNKDDKCDHDAAFVLVLVTVSIVIAWCIGFWSGRAIKDDYLSRKEVEVGVSGYECDPATGESHRYWKVPVGEFTKVRVK